MLEPYLPGVTPGATAAEAGGTAGAEGGSGGAPGAPVPLTLPVSLAPPEFPASLLLDILQQAGKVCVGSAAWASAGPLGIDFLVVLVTVTVLHFMVKTAMHSVLELNAESCVAVDPRLLFHGAGRPPL
jgi:hypothetical protein